MVRTFPVGSFFHLSGDEILGDLELGVPPRHTVVPHPDDLFELGGLNGFQVGFLPFDDLEIFLAPLRHRRRGNDLMLDILVQALEDDQGGVRGDDSEPFPYRRDLFLVFLREDHQILDLFLRPVAFEKISLGSLGGRDLVFDLFLDLVTESEAKLDLAGFAIQDPCKGEPVVNRFGNPGKGFGEVTRDYVCTQERECGFSDRGCDRGCFDLVEVEVVAASLKGQEPEKRVVRGRVAAEGVEGFGQPRGVFLAEVRDSVREKEVEIRLGFSLRGRETPHLRSPVVGGFRDLLLDCGKVSAGNLECPGGFAVIPEENQGDFDGGGSVQCEELPEDPEFLGMISFFAGSASVPEDRYPGRAFFRGGIGRTVAG